VFSHNRRKIKILGTKELERLIFLEENEVCRPKPPQQHPVPCCSVPCPSTHTPSPRGVLVAFFRLVFFIPCLLCREKVYLQISELVRGMEALGSSNEPVNEEEWTAASAALLSAR